MQKVAAQIRAIMGEGAICGRYGGDEFIVILPKATLAVLEERGNRLLEAIRADTKLKELHVTLSIGGAAWDVVKEDCKVRQLLGTEVLRARACHVLASRAPDVDVEAAVAPRAVDETPGRVYPALAAGPGLNGSGRPLGGAVATPH